MADESHTAKSQGKLLPFPPAAEPSPRAPVGIGSRPDLPETSETSEVSGFSDRLGLSAVELESRFMHTESSGGLERGAERAFMVTAEAGFVERSPVSSCALALQCVREVQMRARACDSLSVLLACDVRVVL